MAIKCLLISGAYDSGKTTSLCIFLSTIGDEYDFLNNERPKYESGKYKDCVCLLKDKNKERYLVVITPGDAMRYIDKHYKMACKLLEEHNLSKDGDNVFFIAATRSSGATIEHYLKEFGYRSCLSILKSKSLFEDEIENDNNYFANIIRMSVSFLWKGEK